VGKLSLCVEVLLLQAVKQQSGGVAKIMFGKLRVLAVAARV
jgi:hypothetical protein